MYKLKSSSDFDTQLIRLSVKIKKIRKKGVAQNKLPENIWEEAIALAKISSVNKVAMRIGIGRCCLYRKFNARKNVTQSIGGK